LTFPHWEHFSCIDDSTLDQRVPIVVQLDREGQTPVK
jgi:hypothetical protein